MRRARREVLREAKMSGAKDFSCIGGLDKHIRIVKETVLFPLMYGEVYAKFNLKPPRGLLFYGPPGTGKTLVASALAAECSNSERKVSFISRKGSDCLSKWVGESERKLQKIFSLAQQTKPCIIFFDEVDGLAPIRSSRQDFVHASIVSTLLALMDGLDNNSEIIVIGATNRIDAIDPALRRPGRFDRELYFPLPCYRARKDILSVHIQNWRQKPHRKFLAYLASKTVGFCGSDLQALCAEAVMCCVRRNYPEIYTTNSKHHISERHLKIEKRDFLEAQRNIVPASHRVSVTPVKSLPVRIKPLLLENFSRIMSQLEILCPVGMLACDTITGSAPSRSSNSPRILLCGNDDCHTRHLAPALLLALEHLPCHVLDITTLFEETGRAAEEVIIQKIKTARRSLPSLLYIPDILSWWNLVDEAARVVFTSLMQGLDRSVHMLILSTADCLKNDLPEEIGNIYDQHQDEIFEMNPPGARERKSFFKQLFSNSVPNMGSNQSSKGFVQIMSPRISRTECEKEKEPKFLIHSTDDNEISTREIRPRRKLKSRNKARSKLRVARSSDSTATGISKISVKRKSSASYEGPPTKRSKNNSAISLPASASTTGRSLDSRAEELLEKIVVSTETWSCHQLEHLYSSLESILEKTEENVYSILEECLSRLKRQKRVNVRSSIKPEEN